jgi:glycosyltransferase involved in cell wall biosynthesis
MDYLLYIILIIFIAAVVIQLLYLILFLITFLRKREEGNNVEPVSVVVCAHDEEENLKQLIPVLLAQEHTSFEVIIVNDRSNDGTYDYLLEETKKHAQLKMVNVQATPDHIDNKKFALTLGIRAAAHEIILLTDADCRPKSNRWITRMCQGFTSQTQFVLGFSPYAAKPGFLNLLIRFETLVTALQYLAFAWMKNPYMGVGRNLAYRKSFFLEKKGFNNFLHVTGGDDDLFVNKYATSKNVAVQFHAEAQMESVPKVTWSSFFNQKIRHLSIGKMYRFKHKFLLGIFMFTWVVTWLTCIPLMLLYPEYYVIAIAIVIRWIVLFWNIQTMIHRSKSTFKLWLMPILDFVYPIYYISIGTVALLTKKIRWRN